MQVGKKVESKGGPMIKSFAKGTACGRTRAGGGTGSAKLSSKACCIDRSVKRGIAGQVRRIRAQPRRCLLYASSLLNLIARTRTGANGASGRCRASRTRRADVGTHTGRRVLASAASCMHVATENTRQRRRARPPTGVIEINVPTQLAHELQWEQLLERPDWPQGHATQAWQLPASNVMK